MTPTREAYKTKLQEFNGTEKYKREWDFLLRLMGPIMPGEKILDYGCGLGRAVWELVEIGADAYGHDIINYREKDDIFRFRAEYSFKFDKVIMMHSIAHIPDIKEKLKVLYSGMNEGGKVYVVTPNSSWLLDVKRTMESLGEKYTPDPTVIKHFDHYDLRWLFIECGFKIKTEGQIGQFVGGFNERLFLEAERV